MELTLARPSYWGCAIFIGRFARHVQPAAYVESPRAAKLFEISRRARLVRSFEADHPAPVQQVWEKRLGPSVAPDPWTRHRWGLWWPIWLDDGEPVLALPTALDPSSLDLLFAD